MIAVIALAYALSSFLTRVSPISWPPLTPLEKADDQPDPPAPVAGWRDSRRPFKADERDRAWDLCQPLAAGTTVSGADC